MEVLGNEMSREEAFSLISQRKQELLERIKKGQTEEKVPVGGSAYTDTEWKKLIKKIDNDIDEIKKEQKERKEKVKKEKLVEEKNEAEKLQEEKNKEVMLQGERAIKELYIKEAYFPYKIITKLEEGNSKDD